MSGTKSLRWRLAAAAGLLGGALCCAAAACNSDDSSTPTGSGNDVKVDVDATNQPPQPSYDGGPSPFSPVDGGVYSTPDGYDPYGVCVQCNCPATDYCFGGGGSYTSFSGNCNPTGFGIGCQPLPASCSGDSGSQCDCLLQATNAMLPCYAVCVQGNRAVYCPHP
jgi:hypothetical protein